ncbi:MAG: hypothetical protein WKF95_15410 [Rubrobacter sp.]|jgi:hypothetical protein
MMDKERPVAPEGRIPEAWIGEEVQILVLAVRGYDGCSYQPPPPAAPTSRRL